MTVDRQHLEGLVVRVQNAFLDSPGLRLTLLQAQRRFRIDGVIARAILETLDECGVLTKTAGGEFVQFIPTATSRHAGHTAAASRQAA